MNVMYILSIKVIYLLSMKVRTIYVRVFTVEAGRGVISLRWNVFRHQRSIPPPPFPPDEVLIQ